MYCTPSHHAVGVGHDLAEPERDAQRDGVAVEGVVSGRGQLDVAVRAEDGRAVQHHQRVGSDVAVDVHRQAEQLPRRRVGARADQAGVAVGADLALGHERLGAFTRAEDDGDHLNPQGRRPRRRPHDQPRTDSLAPTVPPERRHPNRRAARLEPHVSPTLLS